MKHRFLVTVTLKEGLANPEGKAIEDAAPTMGWQGVSDVRVGKHITFTVDADSAETARRIAGEMAERLLSNPVIEEYSLMSPEEDA
ncbi:MAG: phosphoribosylformylglycinamidine synthase subunit PurS [Actinomycetota bacterium]